MGRIRTIARRTFLVGAVAIAGGFTYRANTDKVFIRRAGADREVEVSLAQRVPINPGDIVRVPERFF